MIRINHQEHLFHQIWIIKEKKISAAEQRQIRLDNKSKLEIQYENTLSDEIIEKKKNGEHKLFNIICFIVCNLIFFFFFFFKIN